MSITTKLPPLRVGPGDYQLIRDPDGIRRSRLSYFVYNGKQQYAGPYYSQKKANYVKDELEAAEKMAGIGENHDR